MGKHRFGSTTFDIIWCILIVPMFTPDEVVESRQNKSSIIFYRIGAIWTRDKIRIIPNIIPN